MDFFPKLEVNFFGQRDMRYETHNRPSFSIWIMETVRYSSEKISFLGPKIWEQLPQNTKEKTCSRPLLCVKLTFHK